MPVVFLNPRSSVTGMKTRKAWAPGERTPLTGRRGQRLPQLLQRVLRRAGIAQAETKVA